MVGRSLYKEKNMLFPKLYSKDSAGKIRVWWMEVSDNAHRTHSGIFGGQIVTTEWTVVSGKNVGKKNETTPAEQAVKDVEAKYVKQRKSNYFDNIEDVDKEHFITPMLAKKYNDYAHRGDFWDQEWIIQPKLNGHRCVATQYGLFTRTGEKYVVCDHIARALDPIFNKFPDAVLDGEFYNSELKQQLNETSKILRKQKPTSADISKATSIIQYWIYDGYNIDGMDQSAPYIDRHDAILELVLDSNYDPLSILLNNEVYSDNDIQSYYNQLVESGEEGAMLRLKHGQYENKRSKTLLKLKPDDDSEFILLGVQEGKGDWGGKAKIITLQFGDKTFDANFKGTREEAEYFLKNYQPWVGKPVTIKYNGLTGLGTPNYGQFDYKNQKVDYGA